MTLHLIQITVRLIMCSSLTIQFFFHFNKKVIGKSINPCRKSVRICLHRKEFSMTTIDPDYYNIAERAVCVDLLNKPQSSKEQQQ